MTTECLHFRRIIIDKDRDYLVPESARQVLRHNLIGQRICGW